MGLLKGMSDRQGLEQMRNAELGVRDYLTNTIPPFLIPNSAFHNMLCFSAKIIKDFVKIIFDKLKFPLYNI